MLLLPLAGHESFAAAEGAIGIARTANKVRKEPLRVILNGLGKDAAMIISRINGFTYVKTDSTSRPARSRLSRPLRTPMASALPSSATAPTTFWKALPS